MLKAFPDFFGLITGYCCCEYVNTALKCKALFWRMLLDTDVNRHEAISQRN